MTKKRRLEDYEVFYVELPQAEYMDDIEIQDEYDNASYDQIQGLSDQQVSQIARDSLDSAEQDSRAKDTDQTNQS